MTITLNVPDSEYAGLKRLAAENAITIRALLAAFISDASGGANSAGSDERTRAAAWVSRRGFVSYSESQEDKELRLARADRWGQIEINREREEQDLLDALARVGF